MRFINQKRICNVCGFKKNLPWVRKCSNCGSPRIHTKNPKAFFIVLTILILFIIFLSIFGSRILPQLHITAITPTPSPSITPNQPNGIGVNQVNGEDIGISDGRATIDTGLDNLGLKKRASAYMQKGDTHDAIQLWQQAYQNATNDAEPLIYLEDQKVIDTPHKAYITIIVGVTLSQKKLDGFSRDFLQAAYIAQKECNDHTLHLIDANNTPLCPSNGKMVRLLIANSGSDPSSSTPVARQILQAAKADTTIVGVLGWTTTETTLNVIHILQGHLPIITASNAGDALNGQLGFFRTGSPISYQMNLIGTYISEKLHPQNMVIFYHKDDPYYSLELANSLHNLFPTSAPPIEYNPNNSQKTAQQINNADVVVMATNSVPDLVTLLQKDIPADTNLNTHLSVFTGGTGYELVEAGQPNLTNYNLVTFCTPTYPDIWGYLSQGPVPFDFFKVYDATYNPNKKFNGDYTYSRTNSTTMLAYDDMLILLAGSKAASDKAQTEGKQSFTPAELEESLPQIDDSHPLQGITGRIAFDNDGNPVAKTNLILRVDGNGQLHLVAHDGCFLANTSCSNSQVTSVTYDQ